MAGHICTVIKIRDSRSNTAHTRERERSLRLVESRRRFSKLNERLSESLTTIPSLFYLCLRVASLSLYIYYIARGRSIYCWCYFIGVRTFCQVCWINSRWECTEVDNAVQFLVCWNNQFFFPCASNYIQQQSRSPRHRQQTQSISPAAIINYIGTPLSRLIPFSLSLTSFCSSRFSLISHSYTAPQLALLVCRRDKRVSHLALLQHFPTLFAI